MQKQIKKEPDKFERQSNEFSTDSIKIGDDLSYWGHDIPRGAIFFVNTKEKFINLFGINPIRFYEDNKNQIELIKNIESKPIYQLELLELDFSGPFDYSKAEICEIVSKNYQKAKLVHKIENISLKIKERNWLDVRHKIDSRKINFIRFGIGEAFSVIKNRSADAFDIKVKKVDSESLKPYKLSKNPVYTFGCQEYDSFGKKYFAPTFFNPDIVFYLTK